MSQPSQPEKNPKKTLTKTRAVCALAAFAALASFYSAREMDKAIDANHAQAEQKWPGIVNTPAVVSGGWTQSVGKGAVAPPWRGMEASGSWAEVAFHAPGPGADMTGSPWSGVRVGEVGKPVEIDAFGLIGATPAMTRHWTTMAAVWSPMTKTVAPQRISHSEFQQATGLQPAFVLGNLVKNDPVAHSRSNADVSAQAVEIEHLSLTSEGQSATAPGWAQIQAPAIAGESQVVWAYAQQAGLDEQGRRAVVLAAGYAPLSAVNAVIAEQKSEGTMGAEKNGLIAFGIAAAIAAMAALVAQFLMRAQLQTDIKGLKERLDAQRVEDTTQAPAQRKPMGLR